MALYNIAVSMETADDLNVRAIETVQRINEIKPESAADHETVKRLSLELERLYSTELNTLKEIRALIHAYLTKTLDERGGAPDPRNAIRKLAERSRSSRSGDESGEG